MDTLGTLYRGTCLDTPCTQLARYFSISLSITCTLPAVVCFCITGMPNQYSVVYKECPSQELIRGRGGGGGGGVGAGGGLGG